MVHARSEDGSEGSHDHVEGRLLDGFLLLAAGGSSAPEDVVSVNLSSLQIVDVADEDLSFFVHLDKLDISDNQLSYEHILLQLARLPRLGNLVLACNSINSLTVQAGTLRKLQTLDLSFNELHGDVLSQLAQLPNLATLNLSSNCISSVPTEDDLYGLHALEELVLDSNDLVQFIQWRSLDALPRLRKLSLASNRIKRLKDDAPDTAIADMSYFPALEELDLSSNEIVTCEALPVVHSFQSLLRLRLNDNPCSRNGMVEQLFPGIVVMSEQTKPWYLKGGGCSQKLDKVQKPRVRLDRRKMRKIRLKPRIGRQKSAQQLGVLDEEVNQLLFSLRGNGTVAEVHEMTTFATEPDSLALMPTSPATADVSASGGGVLCDDLSDDELDLIFQERRAKIDRDFNMPTEEPASFMRKLPFPMHSEETPASQVLGTATSKFDDEAAIGDLKKSMASVFLTGTADEAPEASYTSRSEPRPARPKASFSVLAPAQPLPSAPSPVGVTLPPIAPSSRASSSQSNTRPDRTNAFEIGKPKAVVPDGGVREAMRALRAAAMSEYAVAA